jgi:hypothetical protein
MVIAGAPPRQSVLWIPVLPAVLQNSHGVMDMEKEPVRYQNQDSLKK